MSEIHKYGFDAAGEQRSEGRYAVHPDGHVIIVPPNAPLKAGFYWASQDEVDEAHAGPPNDEPESDPPQVAEDEADDPEDHSE